MLRSDITTAMLLSFFLFICMVNIVRSSESEESALPAASVDAATKESIGDFSLSDIVIERNPNYIKKKKKKRKNRTKKKYAPTLEDDDDDDDDDPSDREESSDDETIDTKDKITSLLSSSGKNMKSFIIKNRRYIYMMLIFYLLHRQLGRVKKSSADLLSYLSLHPTDVLKIILFLDFVRKLYPGGGMMGLPGRGLVLPPITQSFTFERVNDRHVKDVAAFEKALALNSITRPHNSHPFRQSFFAPRNRKMSATQFLSSFITHPSSLLSSSSSSSSSSPESSSQNKSQPSSSNHTVIILEFKDPPPPQTTLNSQISFLRHATSFLLSPSLPTSSSSPIEVLLLLESPGGDASTYGLAAAQLSRLSRRLTLTICVDKTAASGGYMMACQASPRKLYASEFAVVGSIGVVSQALNVHDLLERWGVLDMVFRGGRSKAPVGLLGEVSAEGKEVVQGMVDGVHDAFRDFVRRSPRGANVDEVGTGDIWLGVDAVKLGLVDEIKTSDEYIQEKIREGCTVLKMMRCDGKERFKFMFGGGGSGPLESFVRWGRDVIHRSQVGALASLKPL